LPPQAPRHHHIDSRFPFEIVAHLSEIDGKPYVETLTERAFLRGASHGDDEQQQQRLFVNDEQ
jgi:hypothetical protein